MSSSQHPWRPRLARCSTALAAALMVAGCSSSDYRPLDVGVCLPASADVVGTRQADPPRVSCSQPHRYEVYAIGGIGLDGAWPGQSAVDDAAKSFCYAQFESGVGTAPEDLPDGVDVVTIGPTEQSWNTAKDRGAECLVRVPPETTGRFSQPGRSTSS